ncbi:isoprenylcysteine carboxylmethyltransferase family protein [Streptomyces sp. NPDC003038]|uniref:methyltransferase family protein n=1 Tax=unclassified Streptomyces TaxID=2593676 RepID=UPI0033AE93CE
MTGTLPISDIRPIRNTRPTTSPRTPKKALAYGLAAATLTAWYGLEAHWMLRRRRQIRTHPVQPLAAERHSGRVLLAAGFLGQAAAGALLCYAPGRRLLGDRATTILIALPGVWTGLALRHRAVATLGEHHRVTVDVHPGQPLTRTGLYRHLRHPSYAGGLLAIGCAAFSLDHPPAAAVLTGCSLAGQLYRIHAEETVLTKAFGTAYTDYSATTARLIPGVW